MVALNLQRFGRTRDIDLLEGRPMAWRRPRSDPREHVNDTSMLSDGLARIARPLETGRDLGPLLDLIGDARFVLLGEATHGTSEFYTWRTEISKRLIQERGFSFIAVDGD